MARMLQEGTEAYDVKTKQGWRFGVDVRAITSQVQLEFGSVPIQVLIPNADIDVLLPDETDPRSRGLAFFIYNAAAAASGFDLIVKENDDTTAVDTLTEQQGAIVFCDGVRWRAIRGAAT